MLTIGFLLVLVATGVSYQRAYDIRKDEYRSAIAGYYRTYFNREPNKIEHERWVNWALNRWSLERVEREGFIEKQLKATV